MKELAFEFKKKYFQAKIGFEKAQEYVYNNRLKSRWSMKGLGWQELLHEAPFAGFYGSCEGIEILGSQINNFFRLDEEIINGVYFNHLLKILECKPKEFPLKQQKVETTTQVAKFARFVTISSKILSRYKNLYAKKNTEIYKRAIDILTKSQLNNGSWPSLVKKNKNIKPHFACTAEVMIALYRSGRKNSSEFKKGLDWIFEYLDRFLALSSKDLKIDITKPSLLIWPLSEFNSILTEAQKTLIFKCIEVLINKGLINIASDIGDSYYVDEIGRNDYYRFNNQLLFCSTLLNFFNSNMLSFDIFNNLTFLLDDIIAQFSDKGYYLSNYRQQLHFWENYQAFFVLLKFIQYIEKNKHLLEVTFMYINPKYFNKKSFTNNPKLCVVLMPFKESWSDEVFNIFYNVLTERDIECWRSDSDISDDIIMQTLWEKINEAKFIIADCTGRNPNVFYELGIAHTLGKRVFMCAQTRDDFVFDIKNIRSYDYNFNYKVMGKFKKELNIFIDNL